MTSLHIKPYGLRPDEGQRLQTLGACIHIKATSKQTSGAFNLFEAVIPPDFATMLHIHYAEDVAIYVLEGALTIFWGSDRKEAIAGSYFFQPRGIPHGFRVEGSAPVRILYMTIPAGFDCFLFEQELLDPGSEPEVVAARYKIEILGPLPG